MSPHTESSAGSASPDRSPAQASAPAVYRDELAKRVRAILADHDVHEVLMFGGVSFMVDDKMVVAAAREGDLLVRIDPARHDQLLLVRGARDAVMGTDRPMGPGWLSVERAHLESSDELTFWTRTALEFHATQKASRS